MKPVGIVPFNELHFKWTSRRNSRSPTQLGISPLRVLKSMYQNCRWTIVQMHSGMVPVRPALFAYRICRLVRLQSAVGMVDVRELSFSQRVFRNGRQPIESESCPVNPKPVRLRTMTYPCELQVTPSQSQILTSVPHELAPVQSSPPFSS